MSIAYQLKAKSRGERIRFEEKGFRQLFETMRIRSRKHHFCLRSNRMRTWIFHQM